MGCFHVFNLHLLVVVAGAKQKDYVKLGFGFEGWDVNKTANLETKMTSNFDSPSEFTSS